VSSGHVVYLLKLLEFHKLIREEEVLFMYTITSRERDALVEHLSGFIESLGDEAVNNTSCCSVIMLYGACHDIYVLRFAWPNHVRRQQRPA